MTLQRGNAAFIRKWLDVDNCVPKSAAAQGDLNAAWGRQRRRAGGGVSVRGRVASRAYHKCALPALWIRPQHTYLPVDLPHAEI